MNAFKLFVFILVSCFIASSSIADIYQWTDENGIKHYANFEPLSGSKLLIKTKEKPYDEAADRARMEAERQERLEQNRLELAQREAELELREAEVEKKWRKPIAWHRRPYGMPIITKMMSIHAAG